MKREALSVSKFPGVKLIARKFLGLLLTILLLVTASFAEAQQPRQVPRIGFLTAGSASTIAARIEALRQGLRDLGYTEDQNIIIEWRFAEEKRIAFRRSWLN